MCNSSIAHMKYKKGTFVVIPNKQHLKGKPSEMQSIYFWLCEHADDTGGCFPTKDTISDDAGCSHNTTDKYLKQLEDEGFLRITNRRKKGSKEFTSNHYQVLILTHPPKVVSPSTNTGGTGSTKTGSETNPIINSIHLDVSAIADKPIKKTKKQIREESPYIFKEEMELLRIDTWTAKKIIHNYFLKKNVVYENRKQFDANVKRNLKPAIALMGYTSSQIDKTMDYCEKSYKDFGWGLETVLKRISDVVNKK